MKNSGTYLKILIIQSWGWQARGLRPGDGRLEDFDPTKGEHTGAIHQGPTTA